MTLSRLLLIADDYGISPAVSQGIRSLASLDRLTGTGVMSLMPDWPAEAPALRALQGRIAVGLHFTLTDQVPLGPLPRLAPGGRLPSIGKLIIGAVRRQIDLQEIADEFERQLDRFEAFFGAPPDFIDGHQHAHLLPGIWPIVQDAFGRRLDPRLCWLRDGYDPHFWYRRFRLKAGVISTLGRAASNAARTQNLLTNRGFSGFYDYEGGSLADYLETLLTEADDGHLLMVHPGHVDEALYRVDSLTLPRQREFDDIKDPAFPSRLASLGFRIAPPGFLIDGADF